MPDRRVPQNAPWQVKFAYAFGIPAVIAMYLVYYQTNKMDSNLTTTDANISELTRAVNKLESEIIENNREMIQNREHLSHVEQQYDKLLNMMVRVCATTAETNVDRNSCFESVGTTGSIRPYNKKK